MTSENRSQSAFEPENSMQKSRNSEVKIPDFENFHSVNPDAQRVSREFVNKKTSYSGHNEPFYFLNIFKPRGITSFDVIYKLRKHLKTKKIGHSGTLDPLAEGVMQVGVGKATRLLDYLGSDKKYVAKIRFGFLSSTCDAEGDITYFNTPKFTKEELLAALKSLSGQIEQIPPAYSAVKVGGKKLCDLARQKAKKAKSAKNEGFENLQKQDKIFANSELEGDKTCLKPYTALNETALKNENTLESGILDVFSNLPTAAFKENFEESFEEKNTNVAFEESFKEKNINGNEKLENPANENDSLLRNINENLLDVEIPKRNVTIYETKLLSFVTVQAPTASMLQSLTELVSQAPTGFISQAPTEPLLKAPTMPLSQTPTELVSKTPATPAPKTPTEPAPKTPTELVSQASETLPESAAFLTSQNCTEFQDILKTGKNETASQILSKLTALRSMPETPPEQAIPESTMSQDTLKANAPETAPQTLPENIIEAEIEISCSKGTYIRSFAVDLAQKLGTGAYLTGLKRIKAGNFDIKNSIQAEDVNPENDAINPCFALDLPKYELNESEYKKVLNGVSFKSRFGVKNLHNDTNSSKSLQGQYFMLIFQNNLVSIAVLSDNDFVCKKVFK